MYASCEYLANKQKLDEIPQSIDQKVFRKWFDFIKNKRFMLNNTIRI